MISKGMVEFQSKFQFQILLHFYRTAERVTKIKFVIVMVESFDKYHHLFIFQNLFTLLFFHD